MFRTTHLTNSSINFMNINITTQNNHTLTFIKDNKRNDFPFNFFILTLAYLFQYTEIYFWATAVGLNTYVLPQIIS